MFKFINIICTKLEYLAIHVKRKKKEIWGGGNRPLTFYLVPSMCMCATLVHGMFNFFSNVFRKR